MAKEFFKASGVSYEEFNVAMDGEKRREMMEKSGQLGVPVITIDDEVVVGFNKGKLSRLLGIDETKPEVTPVSL